MKENRNRTNNFDIELLEKGVKKGEQFVKGLLRRLYSCNDRCSYQHDGCRFLQFIFLPFYTRRTSADFFFFARFCVCSYRRQEFTLRNCIRWLQNIIYAFDSSAGDSPEAIRYSNTYPVFLLFIWVCLSSFTLSLVWCVFSMRCTIRREADPVFNMLVINEIWEQIYTHWFESSLETFWRRK